MKLKCSCGKFTSIVYHCCYCGKPLNKLGFDIEKMIRDRKSFGRKYGWICLLTALWMFVTFPVAFGLLSVLFFPGYSLKDHDEIVWGFLTFLALYALVMEILFKIRAKEKFPLLRLER